MYTGILRKPLLPSGLAQMRHRGRSALVAGLVPSNMRLCTLTLTLPFAITFAYTIALN